MTDTPTTPQQATEYIVLEQDAEGAWREVASLTARDGRAAIALHLAGDPTVDGTFVATPARSWKPVPVKTRIALDFGSET